jgi:hypothetical protein
MTMGATESCTIEKSAIASSYVQHVMQSIQSADVQKIREEIQMKKRQDKLRELRKKKKTLTLFTPFELRTAKRMRLENE